MVDPQVFNKSKYVEKVFTLRKWNTTKLYWKKGIYYEWHNQIANYIRSSLSMTFDHPLLPWMKMTCLDFSKGVFRFIWNTWILITPTECVPDFTRASITKSVQCPIIVRPSGLYVLWTDSEKKLKLFNLSLSHLSYKFHTESNHLNL